MSFVASVMNKNMANVKRIGEFKAGKFVLFEYFLTILVVNSQREISN